MGACCRTLQEGFAPAALAPVRLAAIYVGPSNNVSIDAMPLVIGISLLTLYLWHFFILASIYQPLLTESAYK